METASLSGLDGLVDLSLRSGVDMRPTLLRILTDLYVQKLRHTPEEERHYTELALRLLDAVDAPTRAAVAARLAHHLSPPLSVLQHLSRDLPEVAEALRSHPLLQVPALTQVTAWHAERSHLNAGESEPGVTDEENLLVEATPAADLLDAATAGELNELFFTAEVHERRLILLNLHVVAPLPPDGIGLLRDPSVSERLEAAALARGREDFAQHLVHSLRIPRAQARRIVHDHLGEPIVVAAKTLDVPRDALYRILLFINSAVGHSVERVHALAALYDEITMQAAEGMVAIWQALHDSERAGTKYKPVTWNETFARGRAAAPQRLPLLAPPQAATQRALAHHGAPAAGSSSARE